MFAPADTDGDGRQDLLYATSTNWDAAGFTVGLMHNPGSGAFSWDGVKWDEHTLALKDTRFISGRWTGTARQGFAYVNRTGAGINIGVFGSESSGAMTWQGNGETDGDIPYDATAFVPADATGDGYTDLYYATPNGGGFDLALFANRTNGGGFDWAGEKWNPSTPPLQNTAFLPGY